MLTIDPGESVASQTIDVRWSGPRRLPNTSATEARFLR
ncbi:MAG: hypothetical protein AVDCRST_MAG87-1333 [uncultured Thermomicrobiales bacterium]|uniref:Uncharacterized protein n=1 Tax=uncultured Thermomicrobiales bacterium TaxID=1645740 RepID=A0A6J4URJ9_9BACT|nr:MAG: hypothetical protein AVDCRST_MAG87-1333 [uncultured Thermomicrobiales bacterium]